MTLVTASAKASSPASPRHPGEFPVLEREGIAYLDSAATSQTPRRVIEAMDRYYLEARATVHRSTYALAAEATEMFEGARTRIAAFTGSTAGETVFTRNATEALNLVAWSWGRANVGAGDVIAVTQMEHHSNLVPWQMLAQERGATLAYVAVTDDGLLDLDSLDAVLARGPKLLAVAHVSNVLATVNPLEEIAPAARTPPARSSSSTARRPCRTCRSTSPRWASTSTPGPGTRPTARPASASCTGAASCSRRCRRGSAAGT